jgi:hypothetical protein
MSWACASYTPPAELTAAPLPGGEKKWSGRAATVGSPGAILHGSLLAGGRAGPLGSRVMPVVVLDEAILGLAAMLEGLIRSKI